MEAPSFDNFRNKLQQLYPQEYDAQLAIRYRDEEGDLITITSSREWETLLTSSDGVSPIKLFLGQAHPKEEEKEPTTVPSEQVPVAEEKTIPLTVEETVVEVATETSDEITSGEKEEFEIMSTPEEETVLSEPSFLDTDVSVFFERLQGQACAFLNPTQNESLKKAQDFLQGLVPEGNSPIVAEIAGAVESVKRALSDGYANLKELPEFKDLLALITGKEEAADPEWLAGKDASLQAMGFTDSSRNRALVIKHKGDLQKVVHALLA